MMRSKVIIIIIALLLLAVSGGFNSPVLAYVMQSSSYRLQQDSINIYGGLGTSTSYKLEDTGGEAGSGLASSSSYKLSAGYQQSDEVYVAISVLGDLDLGSIPGLSGGTVSGTQEVHVTTNASLGYSLYIKATSTPAMQIWPGGADSFADYVPAGADPDFSWSVANTDSEFGFTPSGADIVQKYRDNGSNACNQAAGADTPDRCWDALTMTNKTIAATTAANEPGGNSTMIKFQAQAGSSRVQSSGSYQATIVVTAHAN
jgi:hypothetical protein